MIAFLRNNIGYTSKKGFIPNGLPGSSKTNFRYDPITAIKLVNDFKMETGEDPIITLSTDSNYIDLCEYLQRELQKIGIKINIEVMPTATLRQAKSSGNLKCLELVGLQTILTLKIIFHYFTVQIFLPMVQIILILKMKNLTRCMRCIKNCFR